jgi:hypothetical protein
VSAPAVSKEAAAQLSRWPTLAKKLFAELLEDAASEIQRELLQRAVAAGHSPKEVHAFADQLRALSDDEAFAACTLDQDAPRDYTVTQLLRAEADPLFAFELKGGSLEPDEHEAPLLVPKPQVDVAKLRRITASFMADSSDASPTALPISAPAPATLGVTDLESLLNEATRPFSITWHETNIEGAHGLSLEDAVAAAAVVLGDGVPVPLGLGSVAGQTSRLIVALQISISGRNRAWQLYNPFSNELVWANERDLLGRAELPFADKLNRLMTRIALPARRSTALSR